MITMVAAAGAVGLLSRIGPTIEGQDPAVAAVAVVRLAALGAAWCIAAVSAARLALRTARVTPGVVRWARGKGATAGLAALAVVPVGMTDDDETPGTAVLEELPDDERRTTATTTTAAVPTTTTAVPTTTVVPTTTTTVPPTTTAPAAPEPAQTWTVGPGDSFWAIAAAYLADHIGHAPTDAEIVPYWHRLIAANTARLADPGNPDLIYPGQVMELPPL